MDQLNELGSNVIALDFGKKKTVCCPEKPGKKNCSPSEYKKYLSLLSYNTLMNEAKNVTLELRGGPLGEDETLKTGLILDELNNRLRQESKKLSDALNSLSQELEKQLDDENV